MNDLLFCITSTDRTVINRWHAAFKKEGWCALVLDRCGATAGAALPRQELDLVEICSSLCKSPDELQKVIAERKPVATLAFAAPQNISNSQIIKFLGAGADDFIFSNTDERVLIAKLKAYIRRFAPVISERGEKVESSCGGIRIDRAKRHVEIVSKPDKIPVLLALTQKELEILSLLIGHERQVVPREAMLEKLWGGAATEVYSNCINKHIETLRKKLGPLGHRIKTVYGSGYMFS